MVEVYSRYTHRDNARLGYVTVTRYVIEVYTGTWYAIVARCFTITIVMDMGNLAGLTVAPASRERDAWQEDLYGNELWKRSLAVILICLLS